MRHRSKKHNFSKIFIHPIFVGILGFCILIYITIPIIRNAQKQKIINNEIKELEDEITKLDGNNSDLKKMINYLNSDQFVLEQARLNLNYTKEKEQVAVIKNLSGESETKTNKQIFDINEEKKENNTLINSNAYRWWSYFFTKI